MGCKNSKSVAVGAVVAADDRNRGNHVHISVDGDVTQRQGEKLPDAGAAEKRGSVDTKLSEMQVEIINSTWPIIAKDKSRYGVAVFMDIFLIEPLLKSIFKFQGNTAEDALKDERLLRHVLKFMTFIDRVCCDIENIFQQGYNSRVIKDLLLLGAHHATVTGFDFVYFNVFIKCLHLTWERALREEYTEDVRDTWNTMFEFIVHKIEEGYLLFVEAGQKSTNKDCIREESEPEDLDDAS